MELNAENRSRNTVMRCCSFCRRQGHCINNCNSPRLNNFERSCFNEIELSVRYHEQPRQRFLNWLYEYALHNNDMIKAYAISKLGINIRNRRIGDIVNDIHNYYCERYSIPHVRENVSETLTTTQLLSRLSSDAFNENMDDVIDTLILLNSIGSIRLDNILHNKTLELNIKLDENYHENCNENCNENNKIKKECYICYEEIDYDKFVKLDCSHEFCKECIKNQIKYTKTNICCGLCRNDIKNLQVKTNEILEEINDIVCK